jgi:hypothetical protein
MPLPGMQGTKTASLLDKDGKEVKAPGSTHEYDSLSPTKEQMINKALAKSASLGKLMSGMVA